MRKFVSIILLGLVLLTATPTAVKADEVAKLTTKEEIEKFTDDFMKESMDKHRVAGATVAVVKDGDLLFTKGYGYEDIEKEIPIDTNKSKFQIGSITKTFTAIAAMKLVEEGKIDLDKDINEYLKNFKLVNPYKEKITMRHLLTHTAGFDENTLDFNKTNKNNLSLKEFVEKRQPKVVRRPGVISCYSNYGMTLAGYIVESVSEVPYEEYIEKNILKPLGMKDTKVYTGIEKPEDVVKPYNFDYIQGKYNEIPYLNTNMTSAGSIYSTAEDMSRYINGILDGSLLSDKYTAEMLNTQFTNYEGALGWGYGFAELKGSGYKVIGHDGSLPPYTSMMTFLPVNNIGFFISTNTNSGAYLVYEYMDEFYKNAALEKGKIEPIKVNNKFKTNIKDFKGNYSFLRKAESSFTKMFFAPVMDLQKVKVNVKDNETLFITMDGKTEEYRRIGNSLFQKGEELDYMNFSNDDEGHTYLSGYNGFDTFKKENWYENSFIYIILIIITGIIFAGNLILSIIKKIRKKGNVSLLSNLLSISNLTFCFALLLYILGLHSAGFLITPILIIALTLPCISMGLMIINVIYNWRKKKKQNYIIVATSILFLIALNFFNLIGFNI